MRISDWSSDVCSSDLFGSTGVTVPWDDACPSLLDLAEQAGLSPDFNCRSGLCNTCMSTLVSGAVDYFEEPLDPPPDGKVLLCCSGPAGPVLVHMGPPARTVTAGKRSEEGPGRKEGG